MPQPESFFLRLADIGKRFGTRDANRGISLALARGEVLGIVGENGAGKSTLLKIAYGSLEADRGEIWLDGQRMPIGQYTTAQAIDRGLGMVFQHFMLVPPLTVLENIVLGREPCRLGGLLNLGQVTREVQDLARQTGLAVDLCARVEDLSVGEKQRVEILKVLWRGAQGILLDEPTAVLTPGEVQELLKMLRALAAQGKALALVSHKLDEISAVADRVVVLRRGEVKAEFPRGTDPAIISRAMIGGDLGELPPHRPVVSRDALALEITDLQLCRADGAPLLCGAAFGIHPGEVFGIAGVEGNGQTELIECIQGLQEPDAGAIRLHGQNLIGLPVAARKQAGLGTIPADRQRQGLILSFDLAENTVLGREGEFTRMGCLPWARIRSWASERLAEFQVQPADPGLPAQTLSGGNQQKVVVARELTRPGLRLILCAHPTRGVDVAAARLIHQKILALADQGVAVLLVSSDLQELRTLCQRIGVMVRGRIACLLDASEASDEALGARMTSASCGGDR